MTRTGRALTLIAVVLAACTHEPANQGPLGALKSSQPLIESNYGPDFWHDQYQRKTDLWRQASHYCTEADRRHTDNCEILLGLIEEPKPAAPSVRWHSNWSAPGAPHAGLPELPLQRWPSPTP